MTAFGIYPVTVGAGQIALSPVPGRSGSYEADLTEVLLWQPSMVLTMTTQAELDRMAAGGLGDDLAAVGIAWWHVPVVDFGAPDSIVRAQWACLSADAANVLDGGGKILIHCFGGCGRSGMAALRLMVEAGEDPQAAFARLRAVRPCAVEKDSQMAWAFSGA